MILENIFLDGRRADSQRSQYCDNIYNVEPTLFHFHRWETVRDQYRRSNGNEFNVDSLTNTLTNSEGEWNEIYSTTRTILKYKQIDIR